MAETVDWSRGDLTHSLTVLQVDPYNLADVRGELPDVTGGTLDLDYYGDTRMGSRLTAMGGGWDGTSALRYVHTVSDWTGELLRETLFTGYVTNVDVNGEQRSYTLSSTLHGLETNVASGGMSLSKSSKAKSAMAAVLNSAQRPHRFAPDATDHLYGSAVVFDAGTPYLSILFSLCDAAGDRIDVDEDGVVVIGRYSPPSTRMPDWSCDTSDPRGTVLGDVSYSDGSLVTPERVIVRAEDGDRAITATAIAPAGSPSRHSVRGYCVDAFYRMDDLSPFTREAAQSLASQLLSQGLVPERGCAHQMMYRPLREGMVEQLTHDGETRRWQVSSASLDLGSWTWTLNMRGGWR